MGRKKAGRLSRSDNIAGYVFVGPWILGFFAFTLIPMASSLYLSFTKYDLLSNPVWTGLSNYITMFKADPSFLSSFKTTFIFVFTSVPLKLAFALALATLLRGDRPGTGFFRTVYYLPSVIGGSIAIAVMWKMIFGSNGAVTSFLLAVGAIDANIGWTLHPSTALPSLILLAVWQFGSPMLIFLAGLKQIPASYYEAAAVDGANRAQQFFRITLPCLSPIIFFNFVMQTITAFTTFTQALVITDGGPSDKTLLYALYLYRRAFKFYEMGYSCAMAWILLLLILIMTALIFRSSTFWVHYETKD